MPRRLALSRKWTEDDPQCATVIAITATGIDGAGGTIIITESITAIITVVITGSTITGDIVGVDRDRIAFLDPDRDRDHGLGLAADRDTDGIRGDMMIGGDRVAIDR